VQGKGKVLSVHTMKTVWASQPLWMLWAREKSFALRGTVTGSFMLSMWCGFAQLTSRKCHPARVCGMALIPRHIHFEA
jgi:hypothetical protein